VLEQRNIDFDGPQDFVHVLDVTKSWEAFATPDIWIGALVGIAFVFAAIRLRRWRDEG
jgi:ABC-2 type transport system permease protein